MGQPQPPAHGGIPPHPLPPRSLLRRLPPHRVVRMVLPAQIRGAVVQPLHRDAVLYRTDMHAQVTADAFLLDNLVAPSAVDPERRDGLVRRVFAGDMAQAALDAGFLIN